MTINVSTKKDGTGFDTLYFNQPENSDLMTFSELYLDITDTCITCLGALESLVNYKNYKDANWKPEGQKVIFKVYKSKKPEYDRDLRKYKDTEPSNGEKHLYELLASKTKLFSKFKGRICPWINPMFFELIEQVQKVDDDTKKEFLYSQCDRLNAQVVALEPINELTSITETDLKELAADAGVGAGKKTYSNNYVKPESESEKLLARLAFIKQELASGFEFKDLFDLHLQAMYLANPDVKQPEAVTRALTSALETIAFIIGANTK
ncbi:MULTISPECIES: hypothetical protein [unclassified Microcoleus]|uniref:hypothetical protein n=1 Tax=unclassified Microcoleus TaxID=2642155 RepID=UPI002FD0DDE5